MTTTDPTDPTAPATPGDLREEVAYMVFRAADIMQRQPMRATALEAADQILARVARATDPAPATPPEHQPGVDPDWCGHLSAQAADELRKADFPVLAEHVEALEKWHRGEGSDAWPRRPLSTTPPAGTEDE